MLQLTFDMTIAPKNGWAMEVNVVQDNSRLFIEGWDVWVSENLHVVRGFFSIADEIRASGRGRWSAGEIAYYMRLMTRIAEKHGQWKINQNNARDLAMLYTLMNPDSKGFFRFKETRGKNRRRA